MKSFGRTRQQSRTPDELPEAPFGEDIANPDSRTMPLEFQGVWVRNLSDCSAATSPTRTVISSTQIVTGGEVQRVVAVRYIDAGQVAVVTLPSASDQKEYSLFYFGVSEDGNALVDLENMDWVLSRCSTEARNP